MPRTPDGTYVMWQGGVSINDPKLSYTFMGNNDYTHAGACPDGTPVFNASPSPKPSHVAQTAASRVQSVMTPDDVKDWEADKLLHSVLTRKAEMEADRQRIIEGYK